jgi:hypothetical protein
MVYCSAVYVDSGTRTGQRALHIPAHGGWDAACPALSTSILALGGPMVAPCGRCTILGGVSDDIR